MKKSKQRNIAPKENSFWKNYNNLTSKNKSNEIMTQTSKIKINLIELRFSFQLAVKRRLSIIF